jgi:putative SOS response-associated peptidase YedK
MCGRFARFATSKQLEENYKVREALREALQPRYNIAPTQPVVAVRSSDEGRFLALFRWGLIPSWSKDATIGNRLINARCETVAVKLSFRAGIRSLKEIGRHHRARLFCG